jgi:hypothetical protein
LLFTLLACIKEGVTVVVVLYWVLIEDLVKRICDYGVDCIEWKYSDSNLVLVVVVSVDIAGDIISNSNFLGYA